MSPLQLPTTHDECVTILTPVKDDIVKIVPMSCRVVRIELSGGRVFDLIPLSDEYQVFEVVDGKRVSPGHVLSRSDDSGLWEIAYC